MSLSYYCGASWRHFCIVLLLALFIIILNCYFLLAYVIDSWHQQLAQCTQQISKACVALEAGWWSHHIFVDLALAVDDFFFCSNQTIQTVHARACRGNSQPEKRRNWKLAKKNSKSNAYKYLWSTVAAIKTSIFSTSQIMARNLLPCHFFNSFIFSAVIQGTAHQHGLIH